MRWIYTRIRVFIEKLCFRYRIKASFVSRTWKCFCGKAMRGWVCFGCFDGLPEDSHTHIMAGCKICKGPCNENYLWRI